MNNRIYLQELTNVVICPIDFSNDDIENIIFNIENNLELLLEVSGIQFHEDISDITCEELIGYIEFDAEILKKLI